MDLDNIYKKAEDGLLDRKNMLIFPWETWHFRDWRTKNFFGKQGRSNCFPKGKVRVFIQVSLRLERVQKSAEWVSLLYEYCKNLRTTVSNGKIQEWTNKRKNNFQLVLVSMSTWYWEDEGSFHLNPYNISLVKVSFSVERERFAGSSLSLQT